jgi:hypothetical protein
LYSPGDNVSATLSIIGDPAWLQQGEITFGVDSKNFNFKGFNADGTINFDAQQILFEVLFNTPTDYNLNTGLMDPNVPASTNNSNSTTSASTGSQPGALRRSFIFLATQVTSEFVKGKFTQTLKGSKINQFNDQASKAGNVARPSGTTTATTDVATGTTDAARVPNSATGPNGINSIPTEQPSVASITNAGTATPPTSAATTADGTPIVSSSQANQNLNANSNTTMPNPLPASVPGAPTSDGDIQAFKDYAAARADTGGVQTQTQQDQIAAVNASYNGQGTNLAPAPPILPIKNANETYDQYQAKLENPSNQQVNTTPPQILNKSDA